MESERLKKKLLDADRHLSDERERMDDYYPVGPPPSDHADTNHESARWRVNPLYGVWRKSIREKRAELAYVNRQIGESRFLALAERRKRATIKAEIEELESEAEGWETYFEPLGHQFKDQWKWYIAQKARVDYWLHEAVTTSADIKTALAAEQSGTSGEDLAELVDADFDLADLATAEE
ncbi:MAG: hypothetical protein LC541_18750 [Candidatus Thiodiazotropha sp.]|nr:hypothetical protein [Candidatus Thiodiazotropha sp.]MCM8885308.1 hypothetical protein [Candidatus Thiodiazotropha sp.]MCM8921571.1 hypothetical protein [Candidatus Thiodiazotropha sp.]